MKTRPPNSKMKRHRSISCTPLEWATAQEKADEAGAESLSKFLVERAMSVDLPPQDKKSGKDAIPLTPEEQRQIYERVFYIADRLNRITGAAGEEKTLREQISFFFQRSMDAMIRNGRHDEHNAIMEKVAEPRMMLKSITDHEDYDDDER